MPRSTKDELASSMSALDFLGECYWGVPQIPSEAYKLMRVCGLAPSQPTAAGPAWPQLNGRNSPPFLGNGYGVTCGVGSVLPTREWVWSDLRGSVVNSHSPLVGVLTCP